MVNVAHSKLQAAKNTQRKNSVSEHVQPNMCTQLKTLISLQAKSVVDWYI